MTGQTIFFVLLGVWISFDTFILITRDGRQRLPVAERVSKFIMVGAIVLGMALPITLSPSAQAAWLAPFNALRWVALFVMFMGILGRITVIRWFGKTFTVEVRTPSQLRTSGPYRFVRHPAYAAELLIVLGVAVAFYHPFTSLAALLLPSAGLLYRIHAEEKVLFRSLGASYHAYAAHTKRLIPYVF